MKNRINLNFNFDYDSKTNDFKINGSVSWDGDFEQERKDMYCDNDEPMALEYEVSDEQ